MSNQLARVREAHGGKFTRPKSQWKGRTRARGAGGRSPIAQLMNQQFQAMTKSLGAPQGSNVFAASMAKFLKGRGQRGA